MHQRGEDGELIIGQAKHYSESSRVLREMRREQSKLFQLRDEDTRPISINEALKQQLLTRLSELIGQPMQQLGKAETGVYAELRVRKAGAGVRLANLWSEARQMGEPHAQTVLDWVVPRQ